jgi:3-hydroxyisobutyrate dehydrogenase-like beta-hydroxyacid dehydrogenase
MGHSVGAVLRRGGLRVVTCLAGRSDRTRALAAEAGIEDLPDLEVLVSESDLILSIVAPAAAEELAERLAVALQATGASTLVADCNALAPETVRRLGASIGAAGGRFVDVGIIGSPPRPGSAGPRFYASGTEVDQLLELAPRGLDVRPLGTEVGRASGLKMCYAALTKGLTALATELLVAGRAMGLEAPLLAELQLSQDSLLQWMERMLPTMPPKARRWVREMEEIAVTFEALGMTPRILQGAADLYRWVGITQLGEEVPEARKAGQTLNEVTAALAAEVGSLISASS